MIFCICLIQKKEGGEGGKKERKPILWSLVTASPFITCNSDPALAQVSLRTEYTVHSLARPGNLQLPLGFILGACLPSQGVPHPHPRTCGESCCRKGENGHCSVPRRNASLAHAGLHTHRHAHGHKHTKTRVQCIYLHTQTCMKSYANTSHRQTTHIYVRVLTYAGSHTHTPHTRTYL